MINISMFLGGDTHIFPDAAPSQEEIEEIDELRSFIRMCKSRKLAPTTEILKAIQARHDAMLAE